MGVFPLKWMAMVMYKKIWLRDSDWRIGTKIFQRKHNRKLQMGVWISLASCAAVFLLIWHTISKDRIALIQLLEDFSQKSKPSKSLFREWQHYYLKEQSKTQKYLRDNKCRKMLVWNLIFPLVPLV